MEGKLLAVEARCHKGLKDARGARQWNHTHTPTVGEGYASIARIGYGRTAGFAHHHHVYVLFQWLHPGLQGHRIEAFANFEKVQGVEVASISGLSKMTTGSPQVFHQPVAGVLNGLLQERSEAFCRGIVAQIGGQVEEGAEHGTKKKSPKCGALLFENKKLLLAFFVHHLSQFSTGLELNHFLSSNLDGLAGLWVTSFACAALRD